MKIEFPKDFWWGAATSGPQTEGRFKKNTTMFLIMTLIILVNDFGAQLVQILPVILQ